MRSRTSCSNRNCCTSSHFHVDAASRSYAVTERLAAMRVAPALPLEVMCHKRIGPRIGRSASAMEIEPRLRSTTKWRYFDAEFAIRGDESLHNRTVVGSATKGKNASAISMRILRIRRSRHRHPPRSLRSDKTRHRMRLFLPDVHPHPRRPASSRSPTTAAKTKSSPRQVPPYAVSGSSKRGSGIAYRPTVYLVAEDLVAEAEADSLRSGDEV